MNAPWRAFPHEAVLGFKALGSARLAPRRFLTTSSLARQCAHHGACTLGTKSWLSVDRRSGRRSLGTDATVAPTLCVLHLSSTRVTAMCLSQWGSAFSCCTYFVSCEGQINLDMAELCRHPNVAHTNGQVGHACRPGGLCPRVPRLLRYPSSPLVAVLGTAFLVHATRLHASSCAASLAGIVTPISDSVLSSVIGLTCACPASLAPLLLATLPCPHVRISGTAVHPRRDAVRHRAVGVRPSPAWQPLLATILVCRPPEGALAPAHILPQRCQDTARQWPPLGMPTCLVPRRSVVFWSGCRFSQGMVGGAHPQPAETNRCLSSSLSPRA